MGIMGAEYRVALSWGALLARLFAALTGVIVLLGAYPAFSVEHEVKKLASSEGDIGDFFGSDVAVDRDFAVVGVQGSDDVATNAGVAYVFNRYFDGWDNWGQVGKLAADDAGANDRFGSAVAVWGSTVAIGAPGNDEFGNDAGAVYVFSGEGSVDRSPSLYWAWTQVKKLSASDSVADGGFGFSVDMDRNYIVVGAEGAQGGAGAAYVFYRNQGGLNHWGQVKKLTAQHAESGDGFGKSVAIRGDSIVVGAPGDDDAGNGAGAAYVFQRDHGGTGNWGQVKKLTSGDGASTGVFVSAFGFSVDISDETIVVGSYHLDSILSGTQGTAYVFQRDQVNTNDWARVKRLKGGNISLEKNLPAPRSTFIGGYSVAISGDTIVAGAWGDNRETGGMAYVFYRYEGGPDNWGEIRRYISSDGAQEDFFGMDVAVNGDNILVGASFDDDHGSDSGAAYLFNLPVRAVVASEGDLLDTDGVASHLGEQITIRYSTEDAAWIEDHWLIGAGQDGIIQTDVGDLCKSVYMGGAQTKGDDVEVAIRNVSYDSARKVATLDLGLANIASTSNNQAGYRLVACSDFISVIDPPMIADAWPRSMYVLDFEIHQEGFCFPLKTKMDRFVLICL